MMERKREALLSMLLLFGILVEGGLLLRHSPVRVDLSHNKLYTLSPATVKVLRSLNGTVRAIFYVSDNLPPALLPIQEAAEDLFKEYAVRSGGRFVYERVNPMGDPKKEQMARQHGVGRIQFNVMQKDELKVAEGYLGLVLLYADKKSAIPALTEVENLEYELTSRILKMSQDKDKEVGILVADARFSRNITTFEEYLRKTYRVRRVFPPNIPQNLDVLVIAGWRLFPDSTVDQIRQFIREGKPAIFFTSSTGPVNMERLSVSPLPSEALDSLRSLVGVGLQNSLVKDIVSDLATFQQGFQVFTVRYPFWVVVQQEGLGNHPVTRGLQSVVLPWPAPIDTQKAQGKVTVVLSSSPRAWTVRPPYTLIPELREVPPKTFGQYPLAVIVERGDSTHREQVGLVASTMLLDNQFIGRYPENLVFAANLVDHFVFGDLLAQIRAKSATFIPLPPLSETARFWIKILNTFGLALGVALAGITILRRRNRGGRA